MNIKRILIMVLVSGFICVMTIPAQNSAEAQAAVAVSASTSAFERSLVGTWYYSGKADQPCWISSTDNQLFVITNDKRASRVTCNPEGFFFAPDFERGLRADASKDRILWSNGTWWSRHPFTLDPAPEIH